MDLRSMLSIVPFLSNIYEKNQTECSRDYDLCRRYAKLSQNVIVALPLMNFLMLMLFQSFKVVIYFATGVLEPSAGIYFPMLNGYEELSIVLMHILNVVSAQVCIIIHSVFDPIVYLIFANVMMVPTVIKRDVQELKIALEKSETTRDQIKLRLVQIIQMHLSYRE